MECKTIKRVKKDGIPIIANKKKYKTLYDAQVAANNINAKPKIFIKRVVYQCSQCEFYHVGSSTEMLQNKKLAKPKWLGPRSVHLKVIGSIDISQFDKIKGMRESSKEIKHIIRKEDVISSKQMLTESKRKKNKLDVGQVKSGGLIWRFYGKKKVVKIIIPDGEVKMPRLINILKDAPIEIINNPLSSKRKWIIEYIQKNYIQQMQ